MVGVRKDHYVSADYWTNLPQFSELPQQAATPASTDFLDGP